MIPDRYTEKEITAQKNNQRLAYVLSTAAQRSAGGI